MKHKRIFKLLLSAAIVLSLVFTPVFVSNSYLAFSNGTDEQCSDSQPLEVQQDDAANIQNVQGGTGAEGTAEDQQEQKSVESSDIAGGDVGDVAGSDTEYRSEADNGSAVSDGSKAAPQKKKSSSKGKGSAKSVMNAKNSEPVDFDLNTVVTKAAIDSTKDANGKYAIRAGTKYSIDVTFRETMDKQFPNGPEDTMTYTLPEGLTAADNDEGTFSVRVNDGGTSFTIKGNKYIVSGNKIIVRFKTDDANFDRMAAAANLTFTIAFEGEFDGENTEIKFEDDIVIDLDIDRSSILEVKKTSSEQIDHGKIEYTIEVKSTGVNTDIEVNDNISVVDQSGKVIVGDHDGYAYDPEIVTIKQWGDNMTFESNKRSEQDLIDMPVITSATSSSNITFFIPEMLDGEVIKIKYIADVRADRIPEGNNGKIYAKANNSVSVKSNEDTTKDESTTTSVIDYTPGISKEVKDDPADPGLLHWTITANDAAKVSMAGKKITDTIGTSSQKFLTYAGSGIRIVVFDKEGNNVRSDTISWEDLERTTNSDGKFVSWSYTIPGSDTAPYKYVITYDTNVDTRGEHVNVTVSNKVDIDGNISATGKKVIGPPDGYMDITKRVLKIDLDNKTITWGIDITVPKGGLERASVTDRHPHKDAIYEPVIEDSISVDGLYENERYDVNIGEKQTKINFSYTDGGTSKNGLMASQSGESRTVSVILKTQIKDEWLDNFSVTTHNNAIDLNGKKSASDNIVVEKPALKKNAKAEPAGYRDVNGNAVPVYRYELMLSHVTKDSNTITDEFDTGVLEPYTPSSGDSWYKSNDAWYVYGGGTSTQTKKGGSAAAFESTGTGMKITTNEACMPHDDSSADSPKHFYARYKLVYYLTVRDSAVDTVINRAISDSDGTYPISNKAIWEGKTDDTEVKYEYPGITKDILTSDADLKKIDENVPVQFRIIANPSRKTLNGGNDITLKDTATNLIIDPSSIVIKVDGVVDKSVKYTPNGSTMVYTIPDGKKIEITYSAKVQFKTIGEQGENVKVEFNNVANMLAYKSNVIKTASRQNTGTGAASVPQIKVIKYEAGDMTKKLKGAEFVLLDKNKNPVKDKNGDEVTYTTDKDGAFTVRGDMEKSGWVLEENEYYYLRETKAPEEHILTDAAARFQVSDDGSADQDNDIYYSGGTLSIRNYPETAIDVEKVWTDGNELHSTDEITVKLQQKIGDGKWSDTIRMTDEDNDREWTDADGLTGVLKQDNDWKYTFSKLPAAVPSGDNFDGVDTKVDYRVVETLINGKGSEPVIGDSRFLETRYETGEPDEGSNSSKKITVTNVYVPDTEITLESVKYFEHGLIDHEKMFSFIIGGVAGTDDQGNELLERIGSGQTSDLGSRESKVKFPPVKYTLDDLKDDEGNVAESKKFTYVIKEIVSPETDENGFDSRTHIQYDTKDRRAVVTLKLVNDKLVADVDYGDEDKIEFKNQQVPPEFTKIDVKKVWTDGNEKHDADDITVTLQQKIGDGDWSDTIRLVDLDEVYKWSDAESMTAKLSKDNDWKYTFTQLPVMVPAGEDFKGAYEPAEYRILETEMNGKLPEQNVDGAKYKETTYDVAEASADSPMKVTITNVYVPDTEVSLEAVKVFENGELNEKNVFKFDVSEETVSAAGEKTLKHVSEAATKDGSSVKNGSKGKIYFEPVKYSLDDLKRDDGTYEQQKVFRYVIKERIPSGADKSGFDKKSNIKYDTEEKYATVTLKLNGSKLDASVKYDDGDTPVFTNTKNPPPKPKKPPKPSAKTGDHSNILLFAILMLLSAIVLAGNRKWE